VAIVFGYISSCTSDEVQQVICRMQCWTIVQAHSPKQMVPFDSQDSYFPFRIRDDWVVHLAARCICLNALDPPEPSIKQTSLLKWCFRLKHKSYTEEDSTSSGHAHALCDSVSLQLKAASLTPRCANSF